MSSGLFLSQQDQLLTPYFYQHRPPVHPCNLHNCEFVVIPAEQLAWVTGSELLCRLHAGSQEGFRLEGDKTGAGMVSCPSPQLRLARDQV